MNYINPDMERELFIMRSKQFVYTLVVALVFAVLVMAFNPAPVQAQATATPGPPIMDYVEIQDGEYMAIERTVTIGDLGTGIIGLALLATVFIYVAYRLVVDKLP